MNLIIKGIVVYFLLRGISFRKEFSKLGEVRALFPLTVRMMALTATASKSTWKDICRLLGMHNPFFVIRSPDKPNITYCMEEVFATLVEEVQLKRKMMDKVIIFCRKYDDGSSIYLYFRSRLGRQITEPIWVHQITHLTVQWICSMHALSRKSKTVFLYHFPSCLQNFAL